MSTGPGPTLDAQALLAATAAIERLRPLSDAATPGPWVAFGGYDGGHTIALMRSPDATVSVGIPGPLSGADHAPVELQRSTWERADANAALIVAAVGLVRALLADPAPVVTCTPTEARWCPLHGDCRCQVDDEWDEDMDHDDCPLHAIDAPHGTAGRDQRP